MHSYRSLILLLSFVSAAITLCEHSDIASGSRHSHAGSLRVRVGSDSDGRLPSKEPTSDARFMLVDGSACAHIHPAPLALDQRVFLCFHVAVIEGRVHAVEFVAGVWHAGICLLPFFNRDLQRFNYERFL